MVEPVPRPGGRIDGINHRSGRLLRRSFEFDDGWMRIFSEQTGGSGFAA
jgi:hypothetical protein